MNRPRYGYVNFLIHYRGREVHYKRHDGCGVRQMLNDDLGLFLMLILRFLAGGTYSNETNGMKLDMFT